MTDREDLTDCVEVLTVSPYLVDDRFDRGLEPVCAAASMLAEPARRARKNLENNRSGEQWPGR